MEGNASRHAHNKPVELQKIKAVEEHKADLQLSSKSSVNTTNKLLHITNRA